MQLKERVAEAIVKLKRQLEDLADGRVELVAVDEERSNVRVRLIGEMVC